MFITPSILLIALAIMITAVCLPAVISPKKWQKAIKKIVSEEPLVRILGFIIMIFSFLFLSVHWKLNGGWLIIIPIMGWLSLVKSLLYMWTPKLVYKAAKKTWLKSENVASMMAFFAVLLAICITYVALYQI